MDNMVYCFWLFVICCMIFFDLMVIDESWGGYGCLLLIGATFAPFLKDSCVLSKVLAAESKCLENAIRCGGLAPTKASCIKNILSCLLEKKGKLCLEYLRDLSDDEIKAELSQFKGIGPKTVIIFFVILCVSFVCFILASVETFIVSRALVAFVYLK